MGLLIRKLLTVSTCPHSLPPTSQAARRVRPIQSFRLDREPKRMPVSKESSDCTSANFRPRRRVATEATRGRKVSHGAKVAIAKFATALDSDYPEVQVNGKRRRAMWQKLICHITLRRRQGTLVFRSTPPQRAAQSIRAEKISGPRRSM